MALNRQFFTILLFCVSAVFSYAQTENNGLKSFRYDIAFATESFDRCDALIKSILDLQGVDNCECSSQSSRITIFTSEKEDAQIADEDDFKWVFLEYGLNITQQRREILAVDGKLVTKDSKKDTQDREGGSGAPQQHKSVKIQGKKDYPKN